MSNQDVLERTKQDNHQTICNKTIQIYHIKNVKVGSSSQVETRLKQQGYQVDDCEILHTIEPNTMAYRDVWELEQSESADRGYYVEQEQNWQIFLRQHTNHNTKDADVLAKLVKAKNTPENKQRMSEQTKKQWACPEKKAGMIATLSDGRMAGFKNSQAKPANVYNREDELKASGVCISVWCRENGYGVGSLSKTAQADRSKPSTAKNPHFHKGIRAEYI
jgi:hypothetical protein